MPEYVIVWDNPNSPFDRKEREDFETLEDAQAALAEWKVSYPWNTYRLAEVIFVQEASEPTPMDKFWANVKINSPTSEER